MKHAKSNVVGLIGVLLFGGIVASVFVLRLDFAEDVRGAKSIVMIAIVVGALTGNFLWRRFFNKQDKGSK